MVRRPPPRRFKKGTPILVSRKRGEAMTKMGSIIEGHEKIYDGPERRDPRSPMKERRKGVMARLQRLDRLSKHRRALAKLATVSGYSVMSPDPHSPGYKVEKLSNILRTFEEVGLPERFILGGRRKAGAGYRSLLEIDRGRTIPAKIFKEAQRDAAVLDAQITQIMHEKRVNRTKAVVSLFHLESGSTVEWPAFRMSKSGAFLGLVRFSGPTTNRKGIVEILYNPFTNSLVWMSTTRQRELKPLKSRRSFEVVKKTNRKKN